MRSSGHIYVATQTYPIIRSKMTLFASRLTRNRFMISIVLLVVKNNANRLEKDVPHKQNHEPIE